jgi:hypothetical protein
LWKFGAAAVVAVILIIVFQYLYSPLQKETLLYITACSSQAGPVTLYYDTGKKFQEQKSQTINIPGDSAWHTLVFPLHGKKVIAFRLDPPAIKNAELKIRDIRIVDSRGKTLRIIELKDVKPIQQIRHFKSLDRIIEIQTDEISNDPQLLISPGHPIRFAWYYVFRGTFLLWLFIAGLGAFIVLLLTFNMFRTARLRHPISTAAFFVSIILYVIGVWFLHAKVSTCFIAVSIKAASTGTVQFYFDTGHGFSERQSTVLWINSVDSFGNYRFQLPQVKINKLRFDPPSTDGNITIKEFFVTDGLGRVIRQIPLHQLYPMNQIEKLNIQDEHLIISATRGAIDPQIGIQLKKPLHIPKNLFWGDPLFITLILALWVLTLIIFKIFIAVADKWINIETALRSPAAVLFSESLLIVMVICLFIIYAKGQLVHTFWFLRHILDY